MFDVQAHVSRLRKFLILELTSILGVACADFACSYDEAMPFLLSIPLYTVDSGPRIFVVDRPRLGTFIHIRNLSLSMFFCDFPQFHISGILGIEPYTMSGWTRICNTLASMTSLRYLCISIMLERFADCFKSYSRHENANIVSEFLRPLRSIKLPERGVFDVIAHGWIVPDGAVEHSPFRVIQQRRPPVADPVNRTHELGGFSQDAYVRLAGTSWPPAPKRYSPSMYGLQLPAVT